MQNVAAEMNLSETAFVRAMPDGFNLRWFTPKAEVPLCGHATLAAAHVLWETGLLNSDQIARFHTRSKLLFARQVENRIEIDLPAISITECPMPEVLARTLNAKPRFAGRTPDRDLDDKDYLVELESESAVRDFKPDLNVWRNQLQAAVIVTARGESSSYDFVSRYFAPWWGIDEDPVTGVSHCSLIPYWSRILGKTKLVGFQASPRGGFVHGYVDNKRVSLSGEAVTIFQGVLLS
jgi:predicted PhzF superfamily epimerase YddE/YHI9